MKKGILVVMIAFTSILNAQTSQDELLDTYNDYMAVISVTNVDSMMNYIYPKLFNIVPRKVMQDYMEKTFSDTSIAISFSNDSLLQMSPTFIHDSIHYVMIDYSSLMTMQYLNPEDYTVSDDGVDVFGYTKEMLEADYGIDKVQTDTVNHQFIIENTAQMFAIFNPRYNGWKFLENNVELANLLNMMIPIEVINHFKKD